MRTYTIDLRTQRVYIGGQCVYWHSGGGGGNRGAEIDTVPLECIESNGTQYIDTGVSPKDDTGAVFLYTSDDQSEYVTHIEPDVSSVDVNLDEFNKVLDALV